MLSLHAGDPTYQLCLGDWDRRSKPGKTQSIVQKESMFSEFTRRHRCQQRLSQDRYLRAADSHAFEYLYFIGNWCCRYVDWLLNDLFNGRLVYIDRLLHLNDLFNRDDLLYSLVVWNLNKLFNCLHPRHLHDLFDCLDSWDLYCFFNHLDLYLWYWSEYFLHLDPRNMSNYLMHLHFWDFLHDFLDMHLRHFHYLLDNAHLWNFNKLVHVLYVGYFHHSLHFFHFKLRYGPDLLLHLHNWLRSNYFLYLRAWYHVDIVDLNDFCFFCAICFHDIESRGEVRNGIVSH
mmetsp:Transcript_123444/g.193637  ORF Transcript_123444/g.193637 Transcript_123444/m.193637 type:complete len:287 (+) Transcript_123444:921-1781(+)